MMKANKVNFMGTSDILSLDMAYVTLSLQDPFDFRSFDGYIGYARVMRLIHVARLVPSERVQAITECMKCLREHTNNFYLYQSMASKYRAITSTRYEHLDSDWINSMNQLNGNSQYIDDSYINELKLKHSIKSILSILTKAGKKAYQSGNFENALVYFTKSRDYCNTSSEILDVCENIIMTSLVVCSTTNVYNYCAKADAIFVENIPAESFVQSEACNLQRQKIHVCTALAHLMDGEYTNAARKLIALDFDVAEISEALTQRDIGLYTGILVLASLDRDEINKNFHNNGSFQLFLQCYPDVKQCVVDMLRSRFQQLFNTLERLRVHLQLDIHLSDHVDNLYALIRDRAYVQYFIPYSVVSIPKMMSVFTMTHSELRVQILRLINKKFIDARIDTERNLVVKNRNVEVQMLFSNILKNMERVKHLSSIDKLKPAMRNMFY